MFPVVFISIIIASFTSKAQAISCYLCESAYAMNCGEDFVLEPAFKFDCARVPPPRYLENDLLLPNATACMKKVYRESGIQKVVRSCYFGDTNDTNVGCRTDPALTHTVHEISCHVCDNENYCNVAAPLQAKSMQFTKFFQMVLTFAIFHIYDYNLNALFSDT